MRDVSAFQTGQALAARRRRDLRALAYSKAFGPESCFARELQAEFAIATGRPVARSSIVIRGFNFLHHTAWADSVSFLPLGFGRRTGHNTCYANSVSHVLLRVPALGAWVEKHRKHVYSRRGASYVF